MLHLATYRALKKYERNPMNILSYITTTVEKHRFGKGDRW